MATSGPITDQGVQDFLTDLIAGSNFSGMKCHLYTNNVTPSDSSVLGDFTEATMTGYAAQTVSGWSASSVTSHVGSTVSSQLTFTFTGSFQSIYGVYFTNSAGTRLFGAVRDPNAPITFNSTVNTYLVTVTVTDQSLV